jgi:hypothetical protein
MLKQTQQSQLPLQLPRPRKKHLAKLKRLNRRRSGITCLLKRRRRCALCIESRARCLRARWLGQTRINGSGCAHCEFCKGERPWWHRELMK